MQNTQHPAELKKELGIIEGSRVKKAQMWLQILRLVFNFLLMPLCYQTELMGSSETVLISGIRTLPDIHRSHIQCCLSSGTYTPPKPLSSSTHPPPPNPTPTSLACPVLTQTQLGGAGIVAVCNAVSGAIRGC